MREGEKKWGKGIIIIIIIIMTFIGHKLRQCSKCAKSVVACTD